MRFIHLKKEDILFAVPLFSRCDRDLLTLCRTITLLCSKGFVNDIFKVKCFMTRHLLVTFSVVASDKENE